MLKRWLTALVMVLPLAAHAAPPDSFAPIIEPLMPAVVNISTTQKIATPQMPMFDFEGMPDNPQTRQFKQLFRQFGLQGMEAEPREVNSLGSGFVLSPEGYVVTNNHVVGNADQITVIFHDNTRLPATIVGRDPKTDLALLKVKTDKKLPFVTFGDSDGLRIGDWVIAVGNPFGLGGSVSVGIVSARGRNINAGPFDDFIQTDAAINRGNSGGPLFNARGEVVGINAAIFSPTGGNVGIGFAIPSGMAKGVLDQLQKYHTIHRGWLGVKIQQVTDEIANSLGLDKTRGALVLELSANSPAVGSGLQPGDVITAFDGHKIDEMHQLPRLVADTKIGKKSTLTVWRKGREISINVIIGELPTDKENPDIAAGDGPEAKPGPEPKKDTLGMALLPLTPQVRQQYDVADSIKGGVVVAALDRSAEAAKRGVQPGDVILDVNQQPVEKAGDVKKGVEAAKKSGHDFALMRVARGEQTMFVTISVK